MDSQEVCQLLNITKRTLQSYRNKGIIAFSSVGGKFYYRPKDIDLRTVIKLSSDG